MIAFNHPFKRTYGTGGALAVAHTALAAHFDLENRLAGGAIFDDLDIPVFKLVGFVRTISGISHEQNLVVQLLGKPFVIDAHSRADVPP